MGEEPQQSSELPQSSVGTDPVSIGGNTTVAVILIIAGFVLLSVSVLRHGPISQREMIAIALGVVFVSSGAYELTSKRAGFIFDEEFFIDLKFGLGKVRWQNILGVRWNTYLGLPYLYVALKHPERVGRLPFYSGVSTKRPRDAEPNEAVFPAVAFEVRVDILVTMMQERIDRARQRDSQ